MIALWKNIMFIRYMLRICVVLHISSSFHTGAECTLVVKPQDVEAFSGEVITLNCASSVSGCGNIAWITKDPETFIYANNIIAPSVLAYITVDDRDDGSCNLNIIASTTAAKRYFCKELHAETDAGAELVVIEKNAKKCTREIRDESHIINCYVVSAGKWAPTVVCEQLIEDGKLSGLQGIQTNNTDNNVVTSYWTFITKKDGSCNMISCSIVFQATGRPKERIDPDCAVCDFRDNENHKLEETVALNSTSSSEAEGYRLIKRVLNSDDNYFWTLANRCFPTEFRDLQRGFDDAPVILPKISCSISVIALIATFIICVCTWKQSDLARLFLLALCVALVIAYVIFMTGIIDSKGDCKAAVICVQYFLLVASFIPVVECVDLLLYVAIKTRRKFEIFMLLAAAWVAPIIFMILHLGFNTVKGINHGLVCWLSVDNSFIRSFFGIAMAVVTVDIAFLVLVAVMVYWKKSIHRKNEIKIRKIRSVLWNMSVTCPLLTLGSLFCFLYSLYGSVLFLHLFFVATSLQGVLIFLFHGIFNNKIVYAKLNCGNAAKDRASVKDLDTNEL